MAKRASSLRRLLCDNSYLEHQLNVYSLQRGYFSPVHPVKIPPPAFELPPIPDIQPHIFATGVSESLARSLSRLYHTRANYLHDATLRKLHQIWHELSEIPGESLTESFQNVVDAISSAFLTQLHTWRIQVLQSIAQRKEHRCERNARTSFRSEYVPLLKSHFRRRQYITASERAELVEKTGMTARQITVWFQNHRNRSVEIETQCGQDQSTPLCSKILCKESKPLLHPISSDVPVHPDSPLPQEIGPHPRNISRLNRVCSFHTPAPPHAFPSKFPPPCDYDPFPVRETGKWQTTPLLWPRSSGPTNQKSRKRSIAVDDLTTDFSETLNITDKDSATAAGEYHVTPWKSGRYVSLRHHRYSTVVADSSGLAPARIGNRRNFYPLQIPCQSGNHTHTREIGTSRTSGFLPYAGDLVRFGSTASQGLVTG